MQTRNPIWAYIGQFCGHRTRTRDALILIVSAVGSRHVVMALFITHALYLQTPHTACVHRERACLKPQMRIERVEKINCARIVTMLAIRVARR